MRRIIKKSNLEILKLGLKYSATNTKKNQLIREILESEQYGFCAYTEDRLSATLARDIDHFDPTLKNTPQDGYENWFAISTKLNREKSNKWDDFQPMMHPTDSKFNQRISYENGDYIVNDPADQAAKNLIKFLGLNNTALTDERQHYIRFLEEMKSQDVVDFLRRHPHLLRFPTAVETTFGVQLLPTP
jgi:hypothetical protein